MAIVQDKFVSGYDHYVKTSGEIIDVSTNYLAWHNEGSYHGIHRMEINGKHIAGNAYKPSESY